MPNLRGLILFCFLLLIATIIGCTAYMANSIRSQFNELKAINMTNMINLSDPEHNQRVKEVLKKQGSID